MLRYSLIALASIFVAQATFAEPITINLLVHNGNGADVIKLPLEAAELSHTIKNMLDDTGFIKETMRTDKKPYSFDLPMSYEISNRTWSAIANALKAVRTLKMFGKEFTFSKIKTIIKDFCFPSEKPAKPEDILNFVLDADKLDIPDLLLPAAAIYVDMARKNHLAKPFAKVPQNLMPLFKDYEIWLDDPQLLVQRVFLPIEDPNLKREVLGMAIANNKLYLSTRDGILVVDLKTNKLLKTRIDTGNGLYFSVLAAAGNKLYAGSYHRGENSTLIAIDVATDKIIGDPVLFGTVSAMVVSGDYLYVANAGRGIIIVEVATSKVIGDPIKVGGIPNLLAAFGNKLFVSHSRSNIISVIDLATHRVIGKPITNFNGASQFQVVADALYLTNHGGHLLAIDAASAQLKDSSFPVEHAMSLAAVGTTLCVGTLSDMVLIDATTGKIMGKPVLGHKRRGPTRFAVSGTKLYANVPGLGIEIFDFEKFLYYQK